jgi:2-oxoglutarate dehydrogenase E2 component (dihydrolipoamide succinyltransferase)
MSTDVLMPQMGESIAEGTIVRWIKKVGDPVAKDEPLFEISTDKVDAEIPSPGAGLLLEIRVKEGDTVPVNSVVAVIGEESSAATASVPAPAAAPAAAEAASVARAASAPTVGESGGGAVIVDERARTSPLVRRLAREHGVDLAEVRGTGAGGRITKEDLEAFIAARGSGAAAPAAGAPAGAARPSTASAGAPPTAARPAAGDRVRVEKMSVMRRKIADHMVASVRTSPHVYAAYEVDFGRLSELRAARKADYEAAGVRLTYTAFIARAAVDTIREFPFVNASLDGDDILYKQDVNLGIAVALDQGLIVPVVKRADTLDMRALCRAIQDLADRARARQLTVDDVQDGTFTITNPGIFGAVFGLPILNQPQVAILAVGTVEKRAVVVGDQIAIRPTCWLTLGFDHRLIDGADAGRFLQALKTRLETFDESLP